MKKNVMQDALKMRRGQGLDISILINPADEQESPVVSDPMEMNETNEEGEEESKELGLAPDAPRLEDQVKPGQNPMQTPQLGNMSIEEELAKAGLGRMGKKRGM